MSLNSRKSSRRLSHLEQKQRIARRALTLIREDVILLEMATPLRNWQIFWDFRVTVLTNDLLIVNELMYKPNVTLYIIGGLVRRDSDSILSQARMQSSS